ncbi:MAG: hypothetical protein OXU64_12680 [Gemmatimonadota bacterium]|nr:hypothetical protein [Gemmatimonadota bacterium]
MSFLDITYSTIGPTSVALLLSSPSPPEFRLRPSVIVQEVFLEEAFRHGRPLPSQSYYWTKEWQEAEREVMEEYRRGEYVGFASGAEAAQWLMAD